jgi:branched-subunit amino acid aminotransferase/4-amino-4-deoxychorismate lyase
MSARAPFPERAVWIDGRLTRGEAARVSLFDRGARDGEGLFETLRVYGGRLFMWERHLERMVLSAAELGFPVPPSPIVLAHALAQVLEAERLDDAVARVTVTRGIPGGRPTRAGCWVEAEPLMGRLWRGTRSGEARAVLSKQPFEPGSVGRHKTTSRLAYHLAREEARARDADEALLVSCAGEVLEGSVSNVFVVARGAVATPPRASGILPGITRAFVLERCAALGIPALERVIGRDELFSADEVFLTNAVQEVVPLAAIDGRAIPYREVGVRLRDDYRGAVAMAIPAPAAGGIRPHP